jgi:protein-S-isoprenylcysteine O-methyltransferase Ste14
LSIDFPLPIRIAGALFSLTGIFIQLWTLKVLTTRVITGVPEFIDGEKAKLSVKGPFSRVRHPTYASHTLILIGLCLVTGGIAVGYVAFVDFLTIILIIIPMEEKELLKRFGDEYRVYMAQTPRLFPRMGQNA